MSQIKSPDESLRQYFDELLLDDLDEASAVVGIPFSSDAASTSKLPAQVVSFPSKAVRVLDNEETSFEPSPADEPLVDEISLADTLADIDALFERETPTPLLPLLAPVSDTPAPQFVEPDTFTPQQWQLQKLLSAVKPQVVVEVETASIPVALLEEAATDIAVAEVDVATEVSVVKDIPVVEEIQEWVIEPAVETAVVINDVSLDTAPPSALIDIPAVIDEPAISIADDVAVDDEPVNFLLPGVAWNANGRPEWAQERFDVLLFDVAGLTLAVPLIALGQIQPLTDELTPLFGQADWFMGLQPTPSGKVRTVNTAKFVMPERYSDDFLTTARYVVSIDGVPWGLAVDAVNQPITLNPTDVKWRTERTKRPWLAGTVKEHMCALLDIPRVGQLLMDADKNVRSQVE